MWTQITFITIIVGFKIKLETFINLNYYAYLKLQTKTYIYITYTLTCMCIYIWKWGYEHAVLNSRLIIIQSSRHCCSRCQLTPLVLEMHWQCRTVWQALPSAPYWQNNFLTILCSFFAVWISSLFKTKTI